MTARVSLWLLIALIASIGVGKAVQSDTLDPDLFWHLRVAEQLRTDGVGPIVDTLSYESIKQPWTPYSWLAELGMKWSWDHAGWRIAVAGKALLVGAIIATIALTCLALAPSATPAQSEAPGRVERRLTAVIATAFAAFLTIPYLSFRPATMAILLLAICAWLLLRDRSRKTTSVWLVIPLTLLTTNIHLSAILIPLWIACLLVGGMYERKDVKRYAILLIGTTLACLATPMLPGAVRAAWFYRSKDVMVASGVIAEMQPIYHGVLGAITMVLLFALATILIINRRQLRAGEWLWLLSTAPLMFWIGRFAPIFALIAAPALAATLPAMNDRALRKPIVAVALSVVVLIAVVRIALSFPTNSTPMDKWINRRGPTVAAFPTAAADYVQRNVTPRTGRLINEFDWGGYLAWRLGEPRGHYQVFLDGRTQLYPPEFWRATYLGTDADAARTISTTDADVAIIPTVKPRFGAALKALGWRSVYRDDIAEVLLPP